ncbi:MBL fold metallo-hydrolase [Thiohalobacter sp. COW1]|uniref:MBL fold metallo-hydrolase n=1 Tax=Thiohalobacter sp. COW1 TaxID=2795687 RepID=UPI0019159A22|nr:MBL fold metallo-hydrolase [Thiohalobacter sp. COW1]BCO33215.1 MBL fold metallo-hydrolase [Thiohalobacter sp. COW1]
MIHLLRTLLLGLGLTQAALLSAAGPVATPYGEVSLPLELHQVPDAPVYYLVGLSGVPGAENEGHTSNAGFVVTDAGVVVFDALGTPALGYRMLQRIREVTDQPIERVIVSHYHADHIYGLQAFEEHAGDPPVWAQQLALGYVGGSSASQGEDAERRLAQRREALFPWVDENTHIVAPDHTFEKELRFEVGGVEFLVRHLGPSHAPGDSIMLVEDYGVLFSGDVIYQGRVPFLDSPQTDSQRWLEGLEYLTLLEPSPRFIIPGHGDASANPEQAVRATRDYIRYVREAMREAVQDFMSFDEAYAQTDWSDYEHLPAFDASNRGNAYRIFLEMEAAALGGE